MSGSTIANRYELGDRLGSGGMSTVYRAVDRVLERTVAVKVLAEHLSDDEKFVARFRREAEATGAIGGEHIAQRAIMLEQALHKGDRFFAHRVGERRVELGKTPPVGPLASSQFAQAQPLRAKVFAQRAGFGVFEHPPHLGPQHFGLMQLARGGQRE